MANKARFISAESSIKNFFLEHPRKVFLTKELSEIFEQKRRLWNLPVTMTDSKFLERLMNREIIRPVEINFEGYIGKRLAYVVEGFNIFQLVTALFNKSYLSHFSAVFLNGLTSQVPKNIYVTFEQTAKHDSTRNLEQASIDTAFSKPQRKSGAIGVYDYYRITVLNGMHTGRSGVTEIDDLQVTGIERTLIDVTVRPNYAGGVQAVLNAYEAAREYISLNKLIATLDKMNFIYPWHQAVGFYLEKAGYAGKKLDELKQRPKPFRFYLTYEIRMKEWSEDWQLYYPKGM